MFWIEMITSLICMLEMAHLPSTLPSGLLFFRCSFLCQALLKCIFNKQHLRIRHTVFILTWDLIKYIFFTPGGWNSIISFMTISYMILSGIHVNKMHLSIKTICSLFFGGKSGFKIACSLLTSIRLTLARERKSNFKV